MKLFKIVNIFISVIVCVCVSNAAYAQKAKPVVNDKIKAHKKRIETINADIKFLDNQIVATNKQRENTIQGLVLIRKKIQKRNDIIKELDREIKDQNDSIKSLTNRISKLSRDLDTLGKHHKKLVLGAYKNRDIRTWFMYILASEGIEQGYRRWVFLKNFSEQINKQGDKIIETQNKLNDNKSKLERLVTDNTKNLNSKKVEVDKLNDEEKTSNKYAQSLSKKQAELKKELSKKRAESKRLNMEVERMIKEAIRASQKTASSSTAKRGTKTMESGLDEADVKLSSEFSENKGKLPWPVSKGVVIEQFGEHPHPTLKNVRLPFNNGVNISTTAGADVKSVFSGTVKQIILIPGYNQCVLVQHGKYFTFYCKLRSVDVKAGDKLSVGSVIGSLEVKDNTSVLHFELWNGTTKQNPEDWLK